jgi:murein DD-endopeptidase MepM/ murein hydrolase activator NlpD
VTSPFGQRREFNGEYRSTHMGLDLAGQVGAPVAAANRGVVVLVGDFYYAGNLVYLDHGQGLLTAYLHLSETYVSVGDTVARGEVIGRVGASGRVTGPHLHWIARYGTVIVNPQSLLGLDVSVLTAGG